MRISNLAELAPELEPHHPASHPSRPAATGPSGQLPRHGAGRPVELSEIGKPGENDVDRRLDILTDGKLHALACLSPLALGRLLWGQSRPVPQASAREGKWAIGAAPRAGRIDPSPPAMTSKTAAPGSPISPLPAPRGPKRSPWLSASAPAAQHQRGRKRPGAAWGGTTPALPRPPPPRRTLAPDRGFHRLARLDKARNQ